MNLLLTFSTSLNLLQLYSIYYRYRLMCLTLPILARDARYQSAVRIQEQSGIYLPRFSWVWDGRRETTAGSPVVYKEESKVKGSRRSAACYLVSFAISLGAYTSNWLSVLWLKVLLCSEQCSAAIAAGNGLLWDSKGGKRFLPLHHLSFDSHFNILQYLSLRSSPNSMIWWLRFMTLIKMMMSIVRMRRNR